MNIYATADTRATRIGFGKRGYVFLWLSLISMGGMGGCSDSQPATPLEAPLLQANAGVYALTAGRAITTIEFNNSGGAIGNCTATPTLPEGLSLGQPSCAITGTPASPSPQITQYVLVAENNAGRSAARINIQINSPVQIESTSVGRLNLALADENPDPSFNLPVGVDIVLSKNEDNLQINLQSLGILIENNSSIQIGECGVTPELPMGLSLRSFLYSCVIVGNPSSVSPPTAYTITATERIAANNSEARSTPQTANITVEIEVVDNTNAGAFPRLTDAGEHRLFLGSRSGLPIVFPNIGAALASDSSGARMTPPTCAITPMSMTEAEPFGANNRLGRPVLAQNWVVELTEDRGSCQLNLAQSSFPMVLPNENGVIADSVAYNIRVSGVNHAGRSSVAVATVRVYNQTLPTIGSVPILTAPTNEVALRAGRSSSLPLRFVNLAGSVTSCRLDRSQSAFDLPEGLRVAVLGAPDVASCAIAGLPTEIQVEPRTYTVIATNNIGENTVGVGLSVQPVSPMFESALTLIESPSNMTDVILPDNFENTIANGGDMLNIRLRNVGGPASFCQFVNNPTEKVVYNHPNYNLSLDSDGLECRMTGAVPAFGANSVSTPEPVEQRIYIELSNRYDQSSYALVNIVIGANSATPYNTTRR